MANSADPDQLASEEANCSGSALFAKAGYIQVQQDKCYQCVLDDSFKIFFSSSPDSIKTYVVGTH